MVGFYIESKHWGTVLSTLKGEGLVFAMVLQFQEAPEEEEVEGAIFVYGEDEEIYRWLEKLTPNTRLYLFKNSWDWGWFEDDEPDDDDDDDGEPIPEEKPEKIPHVLQLVSRFAN